MRSQRLVSVLLGGVLALASSVVLAQEGEEAPAAEAESATQATARERFSVTTGLGEWALASQYPEQAVWLELEDNSRALALFRPEQKVPARSAVIVLANEGQTADQAILGALRQTLPDSGMAVMTLGLRAPPDALRQSRKARKVPAPEAGENGDPEAAEAENAGSVMIDVASEEDLEALAENYRNSVRGLLDGAAGELNQRGYERLLVLGVGWSADYVTEWAAGQGALAGVIWLAPEFTPARLTALTDVLAADRDWRLLDLHSTSSEATAKAKERAAELARAEVRQYRRLSLPMANAPGTADADGVASWVSAWAGQ